jgi:hypothetical protein
MSTVTAELRKRRTGAPASTTESVPIPEFEPAFAVPVAGLVRTSDDAPPSSGRLQHTAGQIHRSVDAGRLTRLRGSTQDPGRSTAASPTHGIVRRLRVPKATAGKTVLDTDKPDEFIAAITLLKKAGKQNDAKIEKVIEWLKLNAAESPLITQCQDIWIRDPEDLGAPGKKPATGKGSVKKSAGQKKHEKKEKELQKKKQQEELAQIAADQAKAAKDAQDAATLKAENDFYAPIYWSKIQGEPGNSGHGASLKFLIENKYVKVEAPHRCFLSRFEKDGHGNRENNKFGLSVKLTPKAQVVGAGDQTLVIHLHCGGSGKVFAAGIKFLAGERLPGDNILVESGAAWLDYLQVSGVTGDNVETKVGAFN